MFEFNLQQVLLFWLAYKNEGREWDEPVQQGLVHHPFKVSLFGAHAHEQLASLSASNFEESKDFSFLLS